jgi:ribosomal protein L7Ae-like RNA K-turn-binding protein
MSDQALSLLGLARRAGKLTWHEAANLAAIRSGRAKLLILAVDAGQSTEKKYLDKCLSFSIPLVRFATRIKLGDSLGVSPRTAVAVLDQGFAAKIKELTCEK